MQQCTLCLLLKENQILLAMKKRNFGVGKWNGVGGKPEENETIEETAIREAKEEIGVLINLFDLEKVANFKFFFKDGKWDQHVHIFFCRKWSSDIIESDEMKPQWFDIDKIPYENMWQDDKYWLPRILNGEKLEGEFCFNDNNDGFDKINISPAMLGTKI